LVLCPKKLSNNWTIYQASQNHALNPFKKDRFGYSVLFHTDMSRERGTSSANGINLETFNWGAYDLLVIDESHNFKGNPIERQTEDGTVRMNRAKWLMEKVIKAGTKTKVLMLSATPVNNTLKDLRNQISLITEGKEDALSEICGIKNINQTIETAQKNFTAWANPKKPGRDVKELFEKLDSSFFKLLDELTIARSRKHIKNFYSFEEMGTFSVREKPESLYPEIDLKKRFPSYDKINSEILKYKLYIFNPSAYVKPEKKKKYEEKAGKNMPAFSQETREHYLIGMMKVNFLKRLESSIASFETSLNRTLVKIEKLEKRIDEFRSRNIKKPEEDLEEIMPDESEFEENGEDGEEELWQVGKKLKFDLADLDLNLWKEELKKDK